MDAVRGGVEATVTVTVDVNADGSPVIVETTYKSESRSGFHRKAFLASATEAVKRWKFRHELVAGHVVPGSGDRIPIDYCLQTSSCRCNGNRKAAAEKRTTPSGHYLGEATAAVLAHDVPLGRGACWDTVNTD